MPPTEQCPLGAENKANIENLGKNLDEFKGDVRRFMEHTTDCLYKLTNCYSQRPTWLIAIIITALVGLCVGLAQYCITTGRKNEPTQNPQPITSTEKGRSQEAIGPP